MEAMNNEGNAITPFAVTDYRERRDVFGIKKRDRQGHMYVVGKTGTGKSTMLANMLRSDVARGEGCALVDPHGDLARELLHFVPEERMEEVIYFNPGDSHYPVAFNPLEDVAPDLRHLVVSGLISVFHKLWPESWGPRLEHILRYALLTLLERPGSTILDVPRVLTNKAFRASILRGVTDRHIREFWLQEYDKASPYYRSAAIAPVLNKSGQFLASKPLRYIIGQGESSFHPREVMDEGKILIVNLSKGRIGEDGSSLLGALIVNTVMLAAMARADTPEAQRRPFYLYVDEVHNFLTLAFADILSESRKYGLNLILAHQYIDQLDKQVRSAIFGNVGTIVSFRVGVHDAAVMAKEFHPVFDKTDLIGLPNHHIYLKLMIDGTTSRPFSARTLSSPDPSNSCAGEIIEFSRAKYARPRHEVERDLQR